MNPPLLKVDGLHVRYGVIKAVRGVDFSCDAGQILAIVGPNGAGKSSILNSLAGGLVASACSGSMVMEGAELLGSAPETMVRAGVALVPEGRRIFTALTVEENLWLGATVLHRQQRQEALDRVYARFPALYGFRSKAAGFLSGGEQQQIAIGRALIASPKILLLDEPSLGLAPLMVDTVFSVIDDLRDEGVAIVLVEQEVRRAASIANQSVVLRNGRLMGTFAGHQIDELHEAYFGETKVGGLQHAVRP